MSKNFTKVKVEGIKAEGFIVLCPSLSLFLISKNHGVEPFDGFPSLPLRQFLLFLIMSMYIIYPDNKVVFLFFESFLLWSLSFKAQMWRITESNR